MQARWVPVLALILAVQCGYNNRVSAPETSAAPSTPYVPPTAPTPPPPDVTPPGNASAVLITGWANTLQLSWTPPTDGDYKSTRIYWATSAANLISDATRTKLCEDCLAGLLHTGLTNGTPYHYLLITYDQTGNTATGVTSNGTPVNNSYSCPDNTATDCLQIASFNLEYFVSGFSGTNSTTVQNYKKANAALLIQNAGFDIVALQEVKDYAVFTDWVTNTLGAGWGYTVSGSGCDAKTAFIYKQSLVTLMSVSELSSSPFNTGDWDGCLRRPLVGMFKSVSTSRIFRLIDVHLKSGAGSSSDTTSCPQRQRQANDLNAYINSTNSLPTLLLGDLNDEVKANYGICSYDGVDTLNALETNANVTFLTKTPTMQSGLFSNIPFSSTIDHLVVNGAFSQWVVPARLTYTADVIAHNDQGISDHQPVYLWIKLR
jgi:endonuclease/exonuclease/phosphatase family metal-dependent hydrolase